MSNNERSTIEDGVLIFKGNDNSIRAGFLTLAKNTLLIFADNINSMECNGYLKNPDAIKKAAQLLYDDLMKEFLLKVKMTDRTGRFKLVPKSNITRKSKK